MPTPSAKPRVKKAAKRTEPKNVFSAGLSYAAQALTWHVPHLPYPYWPPSKHHGFVRAGGAVLISSTKRMPPRSNFCDQSGGG